jgi:hypothetical protein
MGFGPACLSRFTAPREALRWSGVDRLSNTRVLAQLFSRVREIKRWISGACASGARVGVRFSRRGFSRTTSAGAGRSVGQVRDNETSFIERYLGIAVARNVIPARPLCRSGAQMGRSESVTD